MSPCRQALLAARLLVESRGRMICFALEDVAQEHPHLRDACYHLQARVMDELALDDAATVGDFLAASGMPDDRGTRTLARLAWIDKLLEDYP